MPVLEGYHVTILTRLLRDPTWRPNCSPRRWLSVVFAWDTTWWTQSSPLPWRGGVVRPIHTILTFQNLALRNGFLIQYKAIKQRSSRVWSKVNNIQHFHHHTIPYHHPIYDIFMKYLFAAVCPAFYEYHLLLISGKPNSHQISGSRLSQRK